MSLSSFRIRLTLSAKLLIASFTVTVLALTSVSVTSYRNSVAVITRNQNDVMWNTVHLAERSLSAFRDQIDSLVLSVAANETLWSQPDPALEDLLASYADYHVLVDKLYIVRDTDRLVGVPKPYVRVLGSLTLPILHEQLGPEAYGVRCSEPYLSPLSHWTVTIGTRVMDVAGRPAGIVAADIPLLFLRQLLPTDEFRAPSALVVVSEAGAPVIAPSENPVVRYSLNQNSLHIPDGLAASMQVPSEDAPLVVELNDEPYSMLVGDLVGYGWRPVFFYSNQAISEARRLAGKTSLRLLVVVGVICLALSWMVARSFGKPLELLVSEMERVRKGRLHGVRVPSRTDEIGRLARAFDEMMERVRGLIDDVTNLERRKREAEIESLLAQVNPHFVYNTLTAVGHSAALDRKEDVHFLIQSLAEVLAFSFDHGPETVALADEIGFLSHYIRLMRITYGYEFDVVYDVAPGVGRFRVPKLLLQPLVENAIFHGLARRRSSGRLFIRAGRTDGHLTVHVEDNGVGMSPDAVGRIFHERGVRRNGIGVTSVFERLRLMYGTAAELQVESEEGEGTRIAVSIPFDGPGPVTARKESEC